MSGSCNAAAVGGAKKKRKLTPYNKFVKKMYAELHKKFPTDTAPQIMKKIGIEWNNTKNK
jgi:hypothetical protein